MTIAILFPEIIKAGKFYYASTPLYSINEPKEFRPLWTDEEVEKARKDGRIILRAKGLGQLTPQQIKVCLIDPTTRHLIKIDYTNSIEKMIKMFSDPNEKRKLLKGE
jgi:DNA gyrase/topoisomerase IV subunit B